MLTDGILSSSLLELLNPYPDGWGVYDSRNFEEMQLKMTWSKNIFYLISIPQKMVHNYILLKVFIKTMLSS
jgi:hypothetical protein